MTDKREVARVLFDGRSRHDLIIVSYNGECRRDIIRRERYDERAYEMIMRAFAHTKKLTRTRVIWTHCKLRDSLLDDRACAIIILSIRY